MPTPSSAPIGVFDSGVGGLSVLKAIRQTLPNEALIYIADSGNAPYGDRDAAFIEARVMALGAHLLRSGAKALVVACNTATVVGVAKLRALYSVPIVAMEPAIKPAVALSRSGVVGVLATRRTLESAAVAQLCAVYGGDARIILQPCPGLVEQVEQGRADSPETADLLIRFVEPLLAAGADTLVLGCTHYPFLARQIRNLTGPDVAILDSAGAVARQLERRLGCHINSSPHGDSGERFFTTGDLDAARYLLANLWGCPVDVQTLDTPPEAIAV